MDAATKVSQAYLVVPFFILLAMGTKCWPSDYRLAAVIAHFLLLGVSIIV